MRGRAVEIEIVLFYVLAVITLVAGQSKNAFLQNGIVLVPQGHRKTDHLAPITDSRQAILIPAIGARSCLIVGEVFPRISVRAVVFTHCAPCTFAEIRSPSFPVLPARSGFC